MVNATSKRGLPCWSFNIELLLFLLATNLGYGTDASSCAYKARNELKRRAPWNGEDQLQSETSATLANRLATEPSSLSLYLPAILSRRRFEINLYPFTSSPVSENFGDVPRAT